MEIVDILRDAIQREDESYELYTHAVALVEAEHIKSLLRELAQEELGHKAALEKLLAHPDRLRSEIEKLEAIPVQDYQIGDFLLVQPLGPKATFQDVCIFASKKEQQSFELYRDLAAANAGEVRDLFESLAKDELRHKNLVEGWYEEVVYQEF
jgi:rubrerythrin